MRTGCSRRSWHVLPEGVAYSLPLLSSWVGSASRERELLAHVTTADDRGVIPDRLTVSFHDSAKVTIDDAPLTVVKPENLGKAQENFNRGNILAN